MQRVRVRDTGFEQLTPLVVDATTLLLEESDHKYEDGFSASEEDVQAYVDMNRGHQHRLYTGLNDSETVVAAADAKHGRPSEGTTVFNLAVQQDMRNSGIGSLLMKQIAAHAALSGNNEIYVVSLADEFFTRLGFTAAHEHIMVAAPLTVIRS